MDVEVIFPDVCGAFYQATLLDIDVSGGKCLLSFQDGWKPNTWVDLQYVRYPPKSLEQVDLTSGAKVEALLPFKEGEPSGWWLSTLTKSKGDIAGIQFQMTSDTMYSDLLEHKFLRMPNENPPLSQMKFYQKEFSVQRDIHEFCRDPKVHSNFRNKIQALSVTYDSEKQSLVVLADDERCLERAELLIEMHLNDLTTQAALKSRTERVAQRLQSSVTTEEVTDSSAASGLHEEKFFIPHELTGFAMGKQGWNVGQARDIPGVVSIDFDDFNSMFTIKAETKEAALNARELLEFTQELQYIPRDLAGKVIGKGGNIVQQILEKSKLNNIKVIGDQEAKERKLETNDVPFEFVGRRKAIENAKMMLDYHLDHLREVNAILKDREEITRKLRDSGIEDPPTYYPRPNPPRPGRGRGRGRQRGGGGGPRRSNRPGRQRRQNDVGDEEEYQEEEEEVIGENGGDQQQHQQQSNEDETGGETESTDEEQQTEENMKRADSPVDGDQSNASPDRRRRKNYKGYTGNRRKANNKPPPTTSHNSTTTANDNQEEDWPNEESTEPVQVDNES